MLFNNNTIAFQFQVHQIPYQVHPVDQVDLNLELRHWSGLDYSTAYKKVISFVKNKLYEPIYLIMFIFVKATNFLTKQ